MNSDVNKCPYCDSPLLRHARQKGVYWFCTSCWQEVPSLSSAVLRSETPMTAASPKGATAAHRSRQ
uniref:hypothetical protein n=1 Tax=Trichocoleus desertorum TaxID=1481672 RepID=UPI0025B3CE60|nr:hypothetical protein [Trichocoleus desertorum]